MGLTRSKQRVADHGEVFTPVWLVEAMLDLVKGEAERIDSLAQPSAYSKLPMFAKHAKHEIFTPVKTYPPMTVVELAALAPSSAGTGA